MKNIGIIAGVAVLVLGGYFVFSNNETSETQNQDRESDRMVMEMSPVSVDPISHATMVLTWEGVTIYTDPVGGNAVFAGRAEPDLVLVTDIHGDHLSIETLEEVVADNTIIVAPQAVADQLTEMLSAKTVVIANGEMTEQLGFSIEAIPMYNLPESDDSRHVKGRGNGYVIERNETRVYIAGDTAGIPEMRDLTHIDIAFVPMNLPYTMSVEEAAEAVLDFDPGTVYPYHYRGEDGLADIERFKELVNAGNPDIEVVLRSWYPPEPVEDGEVEADVVIDMTGRNFEFSRDEIRVQEGDVVTVNFTSEDGFHDFVVDEFRVASSRVQTGQSTSVTFVADEAGTYEYYCSVGEHRERGMVGSLIVE